MRQDNELTRLLEDRYKKVYDPVRDEMVTKEEMAKRTERDLANAAVDLTNYYTKLNSVLYKF